MKINKMIFLVISILFTTLLVYNNFATYTVYDEIRVASTGNIASTNNNYHVTPDTKDYFYYILFIVIFPVVLIDKIMDRYCPNKIIKFIVILITIIFTFYLVVYHSESIGLF